MTSPKKNVTVAHEQKSEDEHVTKSCFIIMPIADHPDYPQGHFNRVYEHLIKPACEAAGYRALRADDTKASHMIMFDILNKLVDCDMAICDLSSKNANVFYELGLRQAFNKKTILITDGRDKAPFDISGFRYVPYTPDLRVDTVKTEISLIAEMLLETEMASEDDVNSVVKLLKMKPATVEKVDLSETETILFNIVNKFQDQIDNLAKQLPSNQVNVSTPTVFKRNSVPITPKIPLTYLLKHNVDEAFKYTYQINGVVIGDLVNIDNDVCYFMHKNGDTKISFNDPEFDKIFSYKLKSA